MSTEQLQALQDNIASDRKHVELATVLTRLTGNRDFVKIIKEGYFEKEAIRLVHLKADPSMQTPERQASITRDIDSIGSFRAYLDLIIRQGGMASRAIQNAEAEIESLEQEGDE